MKIQKVLNNNAVLVKEEELEKIILGSGIGFQKKKGDPIDPAKIEKVFLATGNRKFQELLEALPENHIVIAEEIISYAEQKLGKPLNDHIHLALTDHLSFALERIESGFLVTNKLLNEIKFLYDKEFQIGLWAIEHIHKKLGVRLPEDEAGYIALHLHTAKMDEKNVQKTLEPTLIIRDFVDIIASNLNFDMKEDSIAYQRLLTHLKFAIHRVKDKETNPTSHSLDSEMLEMIRTKYHRAYQSAQRVAHFAESEYGLIFPESEIGYITLHIQRLAENT